MNTDKNCSVHWHLLVDGQMHKHGYLLKTTYNRHYEEPVHIKHVSSPWNPAVEWRILKIIKDLKYFFGDVLEGDSTVPEYD